MEFTVSAFEKFQVRREDVFIVGFPKSGSNWLAYIDQQNAKPKPQVI